MPFNLVDIIMVVFVIAWAVRGFYVGFSLTLTSFTGIVGGIAAAVFFSPYVADMMKSGIHSEVARTLVAYFLLFFIVSTVFRILGILMKNALRKLKLSDIDAALGSVISLLEAIVLCMVILLFVVQIPWEAGRKSVSESLLGRQLLHASKIIVFTLPSDVRSRLDEFLVAPPGEPPDNTEPEPSPSPTPTPEEMNYA
ncbi:MAG: CvpA family protein [Planctomycetota bacterium]|nr:CvpA family protein [Planctomycetota bacterium]